jgi:hypothetical protein
VNLPTASLAAALATLSACATLPHPWPKVPVHSASLRPDAPLDAQSWIALVVGGYDPITRRATSPAIDCTGTQVRWDAPATLCADPSTARAALPETAIGEADVVVSEVDPRHKLVWIIISRYASGDALGPVALVEVDGQALTVEAVGALRANPGQPKLRLVQAGGAIVLIAEGERCSGQSVASCERSARVMTLVGSRFQPSRIVNGQGGCLAAGWLHLAREEIEKTGPGRERRYRVDASLQATPRGLELLELVTVHDRDTKSPTARERLFRRAEGTTVLRPAGADLAAATPSLWARLLETRGE